MDMYICNFLYNPIEDSSLILFLRLDKNLTYLSCSSNVGINSIIRKLYNILISSLQTPLVF